MSKAVLTFQDDMCYSLCTVAEELQASNPNIIVVGECTKEDIYSKWDETLLTIHRNAKSVVTLIMEDENVAQLVDDKNILITYESNRIEISHKSKKYPIRGYIFYNKSHLSAVISELERIN